MQSSMNPSINISNMNMSAENVNLRIRDIVERKAILDAEYIKEIDPKKNPKFYGTLGQQGYGHCKSRKISLGKLVHHNYGKAKFGSQ